jgi:AcrR family transcriptional regulator
MLTLAATRRTFAVLINRLISRLEAVMAVEGDPKARILTAAEELFAVRGYHGATTREIAAAAGMNLAMIHYYFGNKEGLYRAIFEDKIERIRGIFESASVESGTCAERLERVIRSYAEFLCSRPAFVRVMQHEMLAGGTLFSELFLPQVKRNYGAVRGLIEEGVRRGEFRHVDVEITPISIVGMMAFFLLGQPIVAGLIGTGPCEPSFANRLAEHTLNLLFSGLRAGGHDGPPTDGSSEATL